MHKHVVLTNQIQCFIFLEKYLLLFMCFFLCGGLQVGETSDKAEAPVELADIVAKGKKLNDMIPLLMEKMRKVNSLPNNSRDVSLACVYVNLDSVFGVLDPIVYRGDVVDYSKINFPKNGEWQMSCRVMLRNDNVIDLSPLQNSPVSGVMIAGSPNFTSSSQIKNMPQTKSLGISHSRNLTDYSFLYDAPSLNSLFLRDVSLDSIDFSKFDKLTALYIYNDISSGAGDSLKNLDKLESLVIKGKSADNFAFMKNLTSLKTLHISSDIEDLSFIKSLKLEELGVSGKKLTDLSPIADMTSLKSLVLNNVPVSNLDSLLGLKLEYLYLNGCGNIRDVSVLKGIDSLKEIKMNGRKMTIK